MMCITITATDISLTLDWNSITCVLSTLHPPPDQPFSDLKVGSKMFTPATRRVSHFWLLVQTTSAVVFYRKTVSFFVFCFSLHFLFTTSTFQKKTVPVPSWQIVEGCIRKGMRSVDPMWRPQMG